MRILVLSDDRALKRGLIGKHSLSILVELGLERYLFGMGSDYHVIEHNSRLLDVDLATVDYVIVSHEHVPHFGGYRYIAEESPFTPTLIPYGTSESLGSLLRQHGLKPVEVRSWVRLGEEVFVSQSFYGPPYEHFLVVNRPQGVILISGCMHPSITALEEIARRLNRPIYAIIGGFHMLNAPRDVIRKYVENLVQGLRPNLVVPLHCSGGNFTDELRKMGVGFIEGGAGLEIEL